MGTTSLRRVGPCRGTAAGYRDTHAWKGGVLLRCAAMGASRRRGSSMQTLTCGEARKERGVAVLRDVVVVVGFLGQCSAQYAGFWGAPTAPNTRSTATRSSRPTLPSRGPC